MIGGHSLTVGAIEAYGADLHLSTGSSNRIVLANGDRTITLGPRTTPPHPEDAPKLISFLNPAIKSCSRPQRVCSPGPHALAL